MPSAARQAAAHRAAITLATPGGFANALAQALGALLPSLGPRRAAELLARGATRELVESLDWGAFMAELRATFKKNTGAIAAASLGSSAKYISALDLSPEKLAALSDEIAKVHAAEFVTAITERDRKALRQTIHRAVRGQGVHRRALEKEIRGMIGLNLPQQRSYAKRAREWRELVQSGKMTRAGMNQRLDRLRKRMIRQRAHLITNHEARSIAARAQQRAYQEAVAGGVNIVGVDGVFTGKGGETSSGPPRHINCDCQTTTVIRNGVLRIVWVTGPIWCPQCDPFTGVLKGDAVAASALDKWEAGMLEDKDLEWGSALNERERAIVLDADGEELAQITGEKDAVRIPYELKQAMRGGSFSHTHPSGTPFSASDLIMASSARLKEVRAVGITDAGAKWRYRLAPEGRWPSNVDVLEPVYVRLSRDLEAAQEKAWQRFMTDESLPYAEAVRRGNEALNELHHKMWEQFAEEVGIVYERTKI